MSSEHILDPIVHQTRELKQRLTLIGILDASGQRTERSLSQEQLVQLISSLQAIDIEQLERAWEVLATSCLPTETGAQSIFANFYSQAMPHPTDNSVFDPAESTINIIKQAYSLEYRQTVALQHGATRNQSYLAATEAFKKQWAHHPEKLAMTLLNQLIEARAFLQMLAIPIQEIRAYQTPSAIDEDEGEKLQFRAVEAYQCLTHLLAGAQTLSRLKQAEQVTARYGDNNQSLTDIKQQAAMSLGKELPPIIIDGLLMLDANAAYSHFNAGYLDADLDKGVYEKLSQLSNRLFANQQQLFALENIATTFLSPVSIGNTSQLTEQQQDALLEQAKRKTLYQYLIDNPHIGNQDFLDRLAERKVILEEHCRFLNSTEFNNSPYHRYIVKKMATPFDQRKITHLQRYEAELRWIDKLLPVMTEQYPVEVIVSVQMVELTRLFKALTQSADWDDVKVEKLVADIDGYEQQLVELGLQQRATVDAHSLAELSNKAFELRNNVETRIKALSAEMVRIETIITKLDHLQSAANFKLIEPILDQYKQHMQQLREQQPRAGWKNWEKVVNQIARIKQRHEAIETLAMETNSLKHVAINLEKGDEQTLAAQQLVAEIINPILRQYVKARPDLWLDKPGAVYVKSFNRGILAANFSDVDFQRLLTDASVSLDKEQLAAFQRCNHILRECAAKKLVSPVEREMWLTEAFAKAKILLAPQEITELAHSESLQQITLQTTVKPEPLKQDTLAIFAHGTLQGETVFNRRGQAKPRMHYRNIIHQFTSHCRTPHLILEGPEILGLQVFKNIEVAEKFIIEQARSNPELKRIVFTGFSRGGAMGKRLAYHFNSDTFKRKYPDIAARNLEFDIFALDPVAGTFNKGDIDAIEITPNVTNYVSTYQLDEPRFVMKPQGPSRTRVVDPSKTTVTFLRFPGVHTGGTVLFKGQQTQHVPHLTWHLLHDFMVKSGVEFKGGRVPPLTVYDKKQKQSGNLSSSERFFLEEYKYTGDSEQDRQVDSKLLALYHDLKLNRRHYQVGAETVRGGSDHIEDFVLGSDFFINQHERELFKRTFPKVFNYFFEMYQPELPVRLNRYSLAEVQQELVDNLQHPSIEQLAKQYAKDRTKLDPSVDTHYIEIRRDDKTYYYLPGGTYRLEASKFTLQKPVGDRPLDYLERKTLDAMRGYYRNRSEIKRNKHHRQATEICDAVRQIMNENTSDANKALNIFSLFESHLQGLKTTQDKGLGAVIKQVLNDDTVSQYKRSLETSVDLYVDRMRAIVSRLESLNAPIAGLSRALAEPSSDGIDLKGLIQLAKTSQLSIPLLSMPKSLEYFEKLLIQFNQGLIQIKAELAEYERIRQELRQSFLGNNSDQIETLAVLDEGYTRVKQRYDEQKTQFDRFAQDVAELHREKRQQKVYRYTEVARLIEGLKPNQSLHFKQGQFVAKRTRLIGPSGKGPSSKAAFEELLKIVKTDLAEGYLSWQLLDKAVTSAWGKRVLTNVPEIVPEYQRLNGLLIQQIADALTHTAQTLFLKVSNEELTRPGKYENLVLYPNIGALTANFNQIYMYVNHSILAETNIDTRTLVWERWIWVADACIKAGNFHTAMAIGSSFNAAELNRLKATTAGLSTAAKERLAEINSLFATDKNYKNLRSLMFEGGQATVPYVGLITSDITFAKEGNPNVELTELAPVIKVLGYVEKAREHALAFSAPQTKLADALRDVISVNDINPVTNRLCFEKSLVLEPRKQETMASRFITEVLSQRIALAGSTVDKPSELIVTPNPTVSTQGYEDAGHVGLAADIEDDTVELDLETDIADDEWEAEVKALFENLQPGTFLNPVLNQIYVDSPFLIMVDTLSPQEIEAINHTLFEEVDDDTFQERLLAAGFNLTITEFAQVKLANQILKKNLSPRTPLSLSNDTAEWIRELKDYMTAQQRYASWFNDTLEQLKPTTTKQQLDVWQEQLTLLLQSQLSEQQNDIILTRLRGQLKQLSADITHLSNVQLKQLDHDTSLLLVGAGDNSKVYYIDKFLQDPRWDKLEQDIIRYQSAVATVTLFLDELKKYETESVFKQNFAAEIMQYKALAAILINSQGHLLTYKDRLQAVKDQMVQTFRLKEKAPPAQLDKLSLAPEIIQYFENRYLRYLLKEGVLTVNKTISQAQIVLFNITHKETSIDLAKLGVEGMTSEYLAKVALAEQELKLIRRIKNKALQRLLIESEGGLY